MCLEGFMVQGLGLNLAPILPETPAVVGPWLFGFLKGGARGCAQGSLGLRSFRKGALEVLSRPHKGLNPKP